MPLLTQDKAIKEYYEEVKEKYPDVSFEEFQVICKSPMNFVKHCIKNGTLTKILVKHLGKFRVFPSRLKSALQSQERFFNRGIITEEEYLKKKTFYEEYLKELESERENRTDKRNIKRAEAGS